jgi:hypothetical protein
LMCVSAAIDTLCHRCPLLAGRNTRKIGITTPRRR